MNKLISSMVVMAVCAVLSGGAYATTQTATLNVSVTAVPACAMTVTGIIFPNYYGLEVNANGDVTVTCPVSISYQIALNAGQTNPIPASIRSVSNGSPTGIAYDLFQDGAYGIQWGDDFLTFMASPLVDTGDGNAQTHTVYGRMFGGSVPTPGVYTDTVMVTLSW